MFMSVVVVINFMPVFLYSQIAAASSRRAATMFSLVPGVSAAMIIFPEVFISFMGLDKVGAVDDFVYKFYRGVGWLFLGGMFLLMWVL